MAKISVVIPVYNVKNYLEKCLNSVCNQTFEDIEVICVNDSSTDDSLKILNQFAEKDNRIKIINFEENKGVSTARNIGIETAKGEYVGFVDSDDYIDLDFYEKLYNKAVETSAEIVKGADLTVVDFDKTVQVREINSEIDKNKLNFWCQYTTAIFKKDFLDDFGIRFDKRMIVCEDLAFTTKAAICANMVSLENSVKYYYIRRDNSLDSKKYSSAKVESLLLFAEIIFDYVKQYDLNLTDSLLILNRLLAQLNAVKNFKVSKESEDYVKLTKAYGQYVIKKMRLK